MNQPIIIKKKKKGGHSAHHGGSWKVAYADFVTAMMAFFMVMWIMGLSEETRAIVAGYFNDPMGFMKNEPRSKMVIAMPGMKATQTGGDLRDGLGVDERDVRKLQVQIQSEIAKAASGVPELAKLIENIELTVTDEGLRIEFIEAVGAVFFETGSAKIRPAALRLIGRIGPVLRDSTRSMVIEGHTDAAPYPSETYSNWDLSSDRANSFRRALFSAGVGAQQFKSVTGFADTRLRRKDAPTHFSNRRVSLMLPFKDASDVTADLPKEVFKENIEGAFRQPISLAPNGVRLNGN